MWQKCLSQWIYITSRYSMRKLINWVMEKNPPQNHRISTAVWCIPGIMQNRVSFYVSVMKTFMFELFGPACLPTVLPDIMCQSMNSFSLFLAKYLYHKEVISISPKPNVRKGWAVSFFFCVSLFHLLTQDSCFCGGSLSHTFGLYFRAGNL